MEITATTNISKNNAFENFISLTKKNLKKEDVSIKELVLLSKEVNENINNVGKFITAESSENLESLTSQLENLFRKILSKKTEIEAPLQKLIEFSSYVDFIHENFKTPDERAGKFTKLEKQIAKFENRLDRTSQTRLDDLEAISDLLYQVKEKLSENKGLPYPFQEAPKE